MDSLNGTKGPQPKDIPEKFRDDGRLREAYLAGYSDCAMVYLTVTGQYKTATDSGHDPGEELRATSMHRRLGALEKQVRALAGDARDNAASIESIKASLRPKE